MGEFAIEDFSVTDVAGRPLESAAISRERIHARDLAREYRFYRVVVSTVKILDEEALGDGLVVRATVVRA